MTTSDRKQSATHPRIREAKSGAHKHERLVLMGPGLNAEFILGPAFGRTRGHSSGDGC